jgi:plasmid stability protein
MTDIGMTLDLHTDGFHIASKMDAEGSMATLTIKKMPDALYARLKQRALEAHRSINGEAIVALEFALSKPARDPDALLAEMRRARARMKGPPLTEEFINAAKRYGRE